MVVKPSPRSDRGLATAETALPQGNAAAVLRPVLHAFLGDSLPVRFEFWDGSACGPVDGPGTVRLCSVDAVRRVLWAPGELGMGRAFVAGDIDLRGDVFATLRALQRVARHDRLVRPGAVPAAVVAARDLGAVGAPLRPPPEEARLVGLRHSPGRDARAVTHHYDVGNDFYRLVLGPSMTYSCARFSEPEMTLEEAQASKHDLVCRKLGLDRHPGATLLDVGCGWGSMAIHAARHYGASVVGITLSRPQAELARRRAGDAGVADRVEIRVQDYRSLKGEHFDAVASIGMFEHVGRSRMTQYFQTLRGLLGPTGRLLNHAISSPGGSRIGRRTFIGRYVFPDGELQDVGDVVLGMERAGVEVRDLESLREHYSKTLHTWVHNLEDAWEEAVRIVGPARARIWRIYMAGSANGFDDGGISVHQVLGVVPDDEGRSAMPATRGGWG